jgi:DNA-binding CsgD family transcriptional regulator
MMSAEIDVHAYVHDLEQRLQLALFGRGIADPEAAVLLVRGALGGGDRRRAAGLAEATRRLAAITPDTPDMTTAADHVRGLIEQDPAILERAAGSYSAARARAGALEDAGCAWARVGNQDRASALLNQAHVLYEQLGADDDMARVRSRLRDVGVRICRWTHADRPASGWDSLTDTEWRVANLVAQGLSNREVAGKLFLSPHTVAFHLRHVFWKLGVTSRVQLARMAAENENDARSTAQTEAG